MNYLNQSSTQSSSCGWQLFHIQLAKGLGGLEGSEAPLELWAPWRPGAVGCEEVADGSQQLRAWCSLLGCLASKTQHHFLLLSWFPLCTSGETWSQRPILVFKFPREAKLETPVFLFLFLSNTFVCKSSQYFKGCEGLRGKKIFIAPLYIN